MVQKLRDKSAYVVVADTGASTRLLMTSALRGLGFTNVIGVASLTEAMGHLAQGKVDWLITSLFPEDKVNALHILQIVRDSDDLKKMVVSLYVTDAEHVFLPRAFALGLLSWHAKPFNKQNVEENAAATLSSLEANAWQTTFTAAESFRGYLKASRKQSMRVAFETMLVRQYPSRTASLLDLAEACFEVKDDAKARSVLWQVEQRDDGLADKARAMGERYLGPAANDTHWGDVRPGICVVVDPDSAVLRSTEEVLRACGATTIHGFADGESCWDWLVKNPLPSILVMEWRIPGITGPALVQRLRTLNKGTCNVVVNSSLLKAKDFPLVEEMGVAAVLEKPTSRSEFMNCVAWCVEQDNKPTERGTIERRFRALLKDKKLDEAFGVLQVFAKKTIRDDPVLKGLEAELAFHQGDFAQAQKLAKASMAEGNRSVLTMNLLGKALMQLREYAGAMQVFEKANEVSPKSIERLCEMAEVQTELGAGEEARQTLRQAESIDRENPVVITASVKVALATGDKELANEQFTKLPPSYNVVAYVNNRAVALIKSGKYEEGIAQYTNAITAIPTDRGDLKAIVAYNLALAKVHVNDLKGALEHLEAMPGKIDGALKKKVDSLADKVRESLTTGERPRLNLLPKAADIPIGKKARLSLPSGAKVAASTIHCLFGIYSDEELHSVVVEALVANPPALTLRKSS